jgi:hypothetical protein
MAKGIFAQIDGREQGGKNLGPARVAFAVSRKKGENESLGSA